MPKYDAKICKQLAKAQRQLASMRSKQVTSDKENRTDDDSQSIIPPTPTGSVSSQAQIEGSQPDGLAATTVGCSFSATATPHPHRPLTQLSER